MLFAIGIRMNIDNSGFQTVGNESSGEYDGKRVDIEMALLTRYQPEVDRAAEL
jgi:hypothetical protein